MSLITLRADASARTLKPMMRGLRRRASVASDSVMPPTPLDHVDCDLVGRQLRQRIAQRLDRTLHVGLDDQVDGSLALPSPICDMMSSMRLPGPCLAGGLAALGLALLRDVLRQALVLDHDEVVAGIGHARQAEHLHRDRRAGFGHLLTGLVEQRTHAAVLWPQTR